MENPQYILKPKKSRLIIPEFLKLICLGSVFYFALLLNLFLLEYSISNTTHIIILAVLSILIFTEIGLKLSKLPTYYFFKNKIKTDNEEFNLSQAKVSIKKSFFDNLFGTETIQLSESFKLINITEDNKFYEYLQNLIKYAKGGYYGHQRTL